MVQGNKKERGRKVEIKNGFYSAIIFRMKYIIITLLSFIFISNAHAQWITTFSLDNAYSDNPFRLPDAENSVITSFDFGIQHNFEDYSMSYTGSFSRFDQMMDRNFYWHQFAIFGNFKKSEWGFYVDGRWNGSNYNFYDYTNYNLYYNFTFQASNINYYWTNEVSVNTYSELPELDNFELSTNLKVNKSFETRTTLIAGAGFEYKKYLNAYPQYTTTDTTTASEATSYLTVTAGPGGGYGRGSASTYSDVELPSALQMTSWVRLAQSLFNTTGLAIQYDARFLLSGSNRDALIYADESQIFDDPMGYESQAIGTELTQMLPWNMKLKGAYYYSEKNYSTQGIYLDENDENYDESILRKDTRNTASATLQKTFSADWFGKSTISLNLTHQWMKNVSNSYWYNYISNYTSLGLSINF